MNKVIDETGLEHLVGKVKTEIRAKYTKPSGGIPLSDLAEGVQEDISDSVEALFTDTIERNSVKMSESTITRHPTGRDIFREGDRWVYQCGIITDALLRVYESDDKYTDILNYVKTWYDNHTSTTGTGIVSPLKAYSKTDYRLDHVRPALTALRLYNTYGTASYKRAIDTIVDQLNDQPRTNTGCYYHAASCASQVWLDGIYMAQVFRALYASTQLSGSEQEAWFDDITEQIITAANKTYDSDTGLYRHAWDESGAASWIDANSDNQSFFAWGRALGWFGMAIVDVLDYLPTGHTNRSALITILQELCNKLPDYADENSGVWRLLPTEGATDSRNILESSSSAMFAYVFLKGVRKGYLPQSMATYAKQTYKAVRDTFITESNGVQSISNCVITGNPGTSVSGRAAVLENYYSKSVEANDAHAVAPWIFASVEYELAYPGEKTRTSKMDAKYEKPNGGIPKTDLASSVQQALSIIQRGTGSGSVRSILDNGSSEPSATGKNAVAFGSGTQATGAGAFAEGNAAVASGKSAHAEGNSTKAIGNRSHAEGEQTQATNYAEHAEGQFNKSNSASTTFGDAGNTIHSVGIGTADTARRNAIEVMQNGDMYVLGMGGYDGTNPGQSSNLKKAVYDEVHPAVASAQPTGGMLPNILYNLGELAGDTTFTLATPSDANIVNHYFWTFDTGSTAPTITWPSGISWFGGSAPTINASKHYEISVLNGIGVAMEV